MRKVLKAMAGYWARHFLGLELAAAVLFGVMFGTWVKFAHGERTVGEFLGGQRSTVYGAMVSLDGALLGFVIATTTIVLGFSSSEQFAILRGSSHYRTLWRTFTSTIRVLGVTTLIAIAALLGDRDGKPNSLFMVLCAGTTILSVFRVSRSVWVLEGAIRVVTRPQQPDPAAQSQGPG